MTNPKPRKKTGKSLEKLVDHLEKVLSKDGNSKVERNKKLKGKITGKKREHDVVITTTSGHHTLTTAIECRDRSRPIGVPQIEAFKTKCANTGINQGIIVSPRGFYKTALAEAAHYGIRCLSIEEALSFDWVKMKSVTMFSRTLRNIEWRITPETTLPKPSDKYILLDQNGDELSTKILHDYTYRRFKEVRFPQNKNGLNTGQIILNSSGVTAKDIETNQQYKIQKIVAIVKYEYKLKKSPLNLVTYSDQDTSKTIAEAAFADIKHQNLDARLMFVKKDDGSTQLWLMGNQKQQK